MLARHPRRREPWGQCQTCGFDYGVSQLILMPRRGWRCIGPGTNNCYDGFFYAEDAHYEPRPHEGVRRSPAPLTNTLTEGTD